MPIWNLVESLAVASLHVVRRGGGVSGETAASREREETKNKQDKKGKISKHQHCDMQPNKQNNSKTLAGA